MNWLQKIAEVFSIKMSDTLQYMLQALNYEIPKYQWQRHLIEKDDLGYKFVIFGSDSLETFSLYVYMNTMTRYARNPESRYQPSMGVNGLTFRAEIRDDQDVLDDVESVETPVQVVEFVKSYFDNDDGSEGIDQTSPTPSDVVPAPVMGNY